MKRIFSGTLCKSESVGKAEQILGYLVGPLGFGFLSIMVNNYLNVYYTDVCGLGRLWGGSFMSVYPILVRILDVLTYVAAGWMVDRTVTKQGKARPYLLLSAVLLPISGMLLFLVPQNSDWLAALVVLGSNILFFAVVVTLYTTANTLMIPLASTDEKETQPVGRYCQRPVADYRFYCCPSFSCCGSSNRWSGTKPLDHSYGDYGGNCSSPFAPPIFFYQGTCHRARGSSWKKRTGR